MYFSAPGFCSSSRPGSLSAHVSSSGHALVLSVSLQPLKHILGICLTEVFSQSSVWASPRWSCWVFLWRSYRCLAGWPGAGAAFTRVGMFRAWGCPRAGPRGLPALILCPDGLLCVSDCHHLPAAFTSSPLSCLGSELGRTEARLLAGPSQAAPHGLAGAGASLQGVFSGTLGVSAAGCSGPWRCFHGV